MKEKYILALDQGTTSSRSILFNKEGQLIESSQKEFKQLYPKPGWVEHDPEEILQTQLETIKDVMEKGNISIKEIISIGIANQRETTVVWDRKTGKPIYNAIVWQCRRTSNLCEALKNSDIRGYITEKTGLIIDAYFSATKIKWILDHVPGAKEKAEKGDLLFGTIDSWLIWNLTKGLHVTDYSNASRTMLYNIKDLCWDEKILNVLDIPKNMLPEVRPSSGIFGYTDHPVFKDKTIPISGAAGDQQAALFGQACFTEGMVKNTYGTGCFMLMNTGEKLVNSQHGLLSTIAWGIDNKIEYALEGSVFVAGALIQWLRDEMELIAEAKDSEICAAKVKNTNGVYIVPAFVGLGAPYWDMHCRGSIHGLTRGVNKNHLVRAALEAIAYQTKDIVQSMLYDSGVQLQSLKVDGGAVENNFLMQFQSDILNINVEKPLNLESTALGAAYLAGLAVGIWENKNEIIKNKKIEKTFEPTMIEAKRKILYNGWKDAVKRTLKGDHANE